jgi:hypothetical protein
MRKVAKKILTTISHSFRYHWPVFVVTLAVGLGLTIPCCLSMGANWIETAAMCLILAAEAIALIACIQYSDDNPVWG